MPLDLEKYYDQFESGKDLEEELKKKIEEAEKEIPALDKLLKKKKTKKSIKVVHENQDNKMTKVGPNELVRKFTDFYDDYNSKWANLDENDNPNQGFSLNMAKTEVMPAVEKETTDEVDVMIKTELENLRLLQGLSSKKKKKKKGKQKVGHKKKAKKIQLPGGKLIYEMSDYDILKELIHCQICKYLPPCKLSDFVGEFNYIHSMLDDLENCPFDPSMAIIRQLVTEYVIFPLGSTLLRKRHPAHVRSILFYGPAESGKTMMVRAVACETNSLVFDLSPV